jgi:hypothetical protein
LQLLVIVVVIVIIVVFSVVRSTFARFGGTLQ